MIQLQLQVHFPKLLQEKMTGATFGNVILYVEDLDRTLKFYTEVLGLQKKDQMGDYLEMDTGSTTLSFVSFPDYSNLRFHTFVWVFDFEYNPQL